MIPAGNRAGARTLRIASRSFCESPIWIWRDISPQLLHSRLTVVAATATQSRLERLQVDGAPGLEQKAKFRLGHWPHDPDGPIVIVLEIIVPNGHRDGLYAAACAVAVAAIRASTTSASNTASAVSF